MRREIEVVILQKHKDGTFSVLVGGVPRRITKKELETMKAKPARTRDFREERLKEAAEPPRSPRVFRRNDV